MKTSLPTYMKTTLLTSGLLAFAAALAASGPDAVSAASGSGGILVAAGPGGVSGVTGWFRTVPVSHDPFGDYEWLDVSGNGIRPVSGDGVLRRNRSGISFVNFNPAIIVSDSCPDIRCVIPRTSLSQATVTGVFVPGGADASCPGTVYLLESGNGRTAAVSGDDIFGAASGRADTGQPRVHTLFHVSAPVTDMWGCPDGRLRVAPPAAMKGAYPEVCVFDRVLSPGERLRVESHMAMKYGVTLTGSYLWSDGSLIWGDGDHGESGYHNRVTAIARNDSALLLREVSMTSDGGRLVAGKEWGSHMPDGGYLIWGDNGASPGMSVCEADTLWRISDRRWLASTNMTVQAEPAPLRWHGDMMEITPDGFTDRLSGTEGWNALAWTDPLAADGGAMEFVCPDVHPGFDIGFDNDPDTRVCRYGYRISASGDVRRVIAGEAEETPVMSGANGRRLVVLRDSGSVTMLVDGQQVLGLAMPAPVSALSSSSSSSSSSKQDATRAVVRCHKGSPAFEIAEMRLDGIGETGFFADFSRGFLAGTDSIDDPGRIFLLVDPSGTGVLNPAECLRIRCSDIRDDREGERLVFHNISLRPGKSAFALARYDGNPDEIDNPDDTDNKPLLAPCSGDTSGTDGVTDVSGPAFSVTCADASSRSYTATLSLDSDMAATLMVFDASGRMIAESEMAGRSVKDASFSVSAPGVYIVKAFTNSGEHTAKIAVK